MWIGISALLARAMQLDARQLRTHLFRLAFVVFIYLSLLMAQAQSMAFGAPGLHFLSTIVYLNAIFISLAGVSFFSSAITEEKEEGTLGLLQMAGIGPTSVMLGKSTSRLIQALMLLLVQFPFTLLSITLGGVTMQQVLAAYAALLAYLIGLANLALFWSVICRRTGNAAGLTSIMLVLYFIAPTWATALNAWLSSLGWSGKVWYQAAVLHALQIISESEIFRSLGRIMVTGFSGFSNATTTAAVPSSGLLGYWNYYVNLLFSTQVVTNTLFGVICFGLGRLLYEPFTRDINQLTDTRGLVLRSNSRMKMFSVGRCWNNPLIWKEFHFLAGGYPGLIVKWFAYAGLLALILVANYYSNYPYQTSIDWQATIGVFAGALLVFALLEASLFAARIFHDEIRLQTMSALLMLPRTVPYLGYSKVAGALLGLLPVAFWLVFCGLYAVSQDWHLGPSAQRYGFVVDVLFNPAIWGCLLIASLFLHLTTLLSLFVKWGALPLAFLILIMMFWCCPIFSVMFMFIGMAMENDPAAHIAGTGVLILINVVGSFVLQMMIGARLQEIGST